MIDEIRSMLPLPKELQDIILYRFKGAQHPTAKIINDAISIFDERVVIEYYEQYLYHNFNDDYVAVFGNHPPILFYPEGNEMELVSDVIVDCMNYEDILRYTPSDPLCSAFPAFRDDMYAKRGFCILENKYEMRPWLIAPFYYDDMKDKEMYDAIREYQEELERDFEKEWEFSD